MHISELPYVHLPSGFRKPIGPIASSFSSFTHESEYGIHPSLGCIGYRVAEPSSGPIHQIDLVEMIFIEANRDVMWYWVDIELEWRLVPDWSEYYEIPESIKS